MSTKEEKQREVEQRVREQLPPLDVGQFVGVTEPRPGEIERALRVAERVVFGATLKDAALIEGARWPFSVRQGAQALSSERASVGGRRGASERRDRRVDVDVDAWVHARPSDGDVSREVAVARRSRREGELDGAVDA